LAVAKVLHRPIAVELVLGADEYLKGLAGGYP